MDDNIDKASYLARRMLVDNIWRSARIEGFNTTFPATDAIIRGIPIETTYEESSFIIGMKRGWYYVLNNLGKENHLLTVMEIHESACKGLVRNAGSLRDGVVRISGTKYLPEIPNADDAYFDMKKIDQVPDPIEKALVMFCYLSKKQLFWDGNKRIAQLMTNKVLIENGIGILSIGVNGTSLTDICNLLSDFYSGGDASALCDYLCKCIERV